jgi:uncharacterized protein
MPQPVCQADHKTQYELQGFVRDYIKRITDQWLLVAPLANPAMLEMFRDRDASPLRDQVEWAGEFAGKYLTGAVQVLRLTGDRQLKAWLRQFVSLLISRQADDGYLGPWPKECCLTNFVPHLREKGLSTWDAWGHYHLIVGLLLWHEQTRDRRALKASVAIGDRICRQYLGKVTPRLVATSFSEMNLAPVHAFCLLYKITSNKRYLEMALQIVDEFAAVDAAGQPLAGDYLRQGLVGKEFFQTPKPRWESLHPIMGLVELYWITGEDRFRQAFEQLWWSMLQGDRHNSGGFSSGEQATGNPYDPGAIETCCTIAWIALSVEMLKLTASSVVADEIELSTLNSVIGMHSSSGRWATYNTPMDGFRRASAHEIVFQSRPGSPELNCCSVNSPRGFGMISDWAVMRDEHGILLNYYGPSRMTVPLGGGVTVLVAQTTVYPVLGDIDMEVSPSKTVSFTLRLRIPYWSRTTTVKLNGRTVKGVQPGQYLAIARRWQKGDRIRIHLDMSLHFWRGERECRGRTSIYRGPWLLAFDHRYNLHLAGQTDRQACGQNPAKPFDRNLLHIPALDGNALRCKAVSWPDWLPPLLLMEVAATDGKKVRLCDYGSAGECGTPYVTWLPVIHAPPAVPFSRENPLRSRRA